MIYEFLTQQTKESILQIAANKQLTFDYQKAADYFSNTYNNRFAEIINTLKSDSNQADILEGLKNKRIDPLVKITFQISLKEACVQYANEIINNSL